MISRAADPVKADLLSVSGILKGLDDGKKAAAALDPSDTKQGQGFGDIDDAPKADFKSWIKPTE